MFILQLHILLTASVVNPLYITIISQYDWFITLAHNTTFYPQAVINENKYLIQSSPVSIDY